MKIYKTQKLAEFLKGINQSNKLIALKRLQPIEEIQPVEKKEDNSQ